jgi:16S rRNA (guanine(966)-N(2))-methyltransferase RsmD
MDRVKTALFDILAPHIAGVRFLDLFAGTGGIGIEALSRGARSATFVELSPEIVKLVRENLAITGLAAHADVLRADAFKFLESAATTGRRYDIIYVAPPQWEGLAAEVVERLDARPLTEPGGRVIAQIHPRERTNFQEMGALSRLRLTDERRYGSTLLLFFDHDGDVADAADHHDEERPV